MKPKSLSRRATPQPQSERVLEWIERHIESKRLGIGDALPYELEIATATGASRSSVREALTALKALGIIVSKRKGGIRIVRNPVLLHLRHYFVERYSDLKQQQEAMEFRAALEMGLAELVYANIQTKTPRELEEIVDACSRKPAGETDLISEEIEFHSRLIAASGNALAALWAGVITPVFSSISEPPDVSTAGIELWVNEHRELLAGLKVRSKERFMKAIAAHTGSYMSAKEQRALEVSMSGFGHARGELGGRVILQTLVPARTCGRNWIRSVSTSSSR